MSNAIRGLQRNVIKTKCYEQNHNLKGFKDAWQKFHYARVEEETKNGIIARRKRIGDKKKQRHEDDGRIIVGRLKAMKRWIETARENANKEKVNNKATV